MELRAVCTGSSQAVARQYGNENECLSSQTGEDFCAAAEGPFPLRPRTQIYHILATAIRLEIHLPVQEQNRLEISGSRPPCADSREIVLRGATFVQICRNLGPAPAVFLSSFGAPHKALTRKRLEAAGP